jgi:glucosylceramidase
MKNITFGNKKRTMKNLIFVLSIFCLLASCSSQKKEVTQFLFSAEGKTTAIFTTADSTDLRLSQTGNVQFVPAVQPKETEVCVFVNPEKRFQTLLGIGGAITDASAEVFAKMPPDKQQELLTAYYDPEKGIGYSLARTNIHSCDFSSGSYTYVEEGDAALKTFSLAHDEKFKIPLIKKAVETAGGKLTLFASPWSPPAFMKSNKSMLHGGSLLPEFYQSWANYYVKFVKSYEIEGLPIWGLSIQNEPMATQTWESCIYTAEEERDFLKNFLGPTLDKEGLGDKKIIVWDHNRDLMNYRANVIFSDPGAAKYAWGMGFHWYETWTGGLPMFANVGKVHEAWPDKNLIFTEGCAESFNKEKYSFWPYGEKYGASMINDFNNGTCGWTDWNILLDEQGGPNHVGNFCFAPVHYDTQTGLLIYTPSYYYIGHFSRFIRPGAKMVNTVSSRSALLSTSFLNSDGKMATVVMNQSGKAIVFKLFAGAFMTEVKIPAHAIQTIVY